MEGLGSLFGEEDEVEAVVEVKKDDVVDANMEVRLAMSGNVDSGKSTLIGVLCAGR